MIKKAVFADELMAGMQRELQSFEKKEGMQNLVKAVEYLQAAAEIFEEAGMTVKADQVLKILTKIAHNYGPGDVIEFESLSPKTETGPGETLEFESLLGKPSTKPGDTLQFESLMGGRGEPKGEGEEISFQSLLADDQDADDNDAKGKPRKPKNPAKISDRHTKGLTPEKMVENLKNHGSMFNLADDNNVDVPQPPSFNEPGGDYDKWLEMAKGDKPKKKVTMEDIDPDLVGLISLDDSKADDLLNLDIEMPKFEGAEKSLKDGHSGGKTFEDSD